MATQPISSFFEKTGCPYGEIKDLIITLKDDSIDLDKNIYLSRAYNLLGSFYNWMDNQGITYELQGNLLKAVRDGREFLFYFNNNYFRHTDATKQYYLDNKDPDSEFLILGIDIDQDGMKDGVIADNYGYMVFYQLGTEQMSNYRTKPDPFLTKNEIYFCTFDEDVNNIYLKVNSNLPNFTWLDDTNIPNPELVQSLLSGNALNLPGNNLLRGNNLDFISDINNYTISMFFNGTGTLGIGDAATKDAYGYIIDIDSSGNVNITDGVNVLQSLGTVGLNDLNFIALTPSTVYINNNEITLDSSVTSRGIFGTQDILIGGSVSFGTYFNGYVDNLRIYQEILDSSKISLLKSKY